MIITTIMKGGSTCVFFSSTKEYCFDSDFEIFFHKSKYASVPTDTGPLCLCALDLLMLLIRIKVYLA